MTSLRQLEGVTVWWGGEGLLSVHTLSHGYLVGEGGGAVNLIDRSKYNS